MRLCYSIPVTFVLSSFLFHIQSFHTVQIKPYLSLSSGHTSIAVTETVKAVLTRAFCNRNNNVAETCLICTKHCEGTVTDPLWQIFRLQYLFLFWDEKGISHSFYCEEQEMSSTPFKEMFWFFFFPAAFLCSSFLWYLIIFKIHPFGCIFLVLLGQLLIFSRQKPKWF